MEWRERSAPRRRDCTRRQLSESTSPHFPRTLPRLPPRFCVDAFTWSADVPLTSRFSPQNGQHAEVVRGVCGARRLPRDVPEQLGGRLPPQTRESGQQRVSRGMGQIPRSRQALCQPHHPTEVSQLRQDAFQTSGPWFGFNQTNPEKKYKAYKLTNSPSHICRF